MAYYIDLIMQLLEKPLTLDEQVAILAQLNIDNIDSESLASIIRLFRDRMLPIKKIAENTVDLVGTGGDHSGSFNISTTASFVVAASGVPIAKHGNRSVTSRSGSFDCLEALGVIIPETPASAEQQLQRFGISFLFAPYFHPAFAIFKEARKVLSQQGKKTIFNVLGPLLNPANAQRLAIGVYDKSLIKLFIETLQLLGAKKALVINGSGLDEFTLINKTNYAVLENGKVSYVELLPEQLGFARCTLSDLNGGDAQQNAKISREILSNCLTGAKRNIVIVNAATAIYVGRDDISLLQAIAIAEEALEKGRALKVLENLRSHNEYTR